MICKKASLRIKLLIAMFMLGSFDIKLGRERFIAAGTFN